MIIKQLYLLTIVFIFVILNNCTSPNTSNSLNNKDCNLTFQITYPDSTTETHNISIDGAEVFGAWVADSTTNVLLIATENSDPFSFKMTIPGTKIGNYEWGSMSYTPDVHIDMDFESFDYYGSTTGETEIIEYNKVGRNVVGKFKGAFYRRFDLFGPQLIIEGEFDLIRLPDNHKIGS